MLAKGLVNFVRGSKHPRAKLTEKDIPTIRDLLNKNLSSYKIAKMFGVSSQTIKSIKTNRIWRHVEVKQ
jgi:DNA invertase Pin-like site-specific DNA recombinase